MVNRSGGTLTLVFLFIAHAGAFRAVGGRMFDCALRRGMGRLPLAAERLRRSASMGLDIMKERGTTLDKQTFTWKELVQVPYSKLDDDAFTRVRVILMNGIEAEAL